MTEPTLRAPRNDDWVAILTLAELSLTELAKAPSQQEWLNNRKSFSPSDGIQQHFVATSGERIVGYACIEHRNQTIEGKKTADGVYLISVRVARGLRNTRLTLAFCPISKRWDF